MIRAYEAFSKKLHDSLHNKEDGLKYFDTYPYEPEVFYRMKELKLPTATGSGSSTMDEAREALWGPTAELGTSQTTPRKLNRTASPGVKPSDGQTRQQDLQPGSAAVIPRVGNYKQDTKSYDIQLGQEERPSRSSSETRLVEPSMDPKLAVQDQVLEPELTSEIRAEWERFWERAFEINDDQRSAVDSMRSLISKFANEISKNQETVMTSAFDTLGAATTISRAGLDFMYDQFKTSGNITIGVDDIPQSDESSHPGNLRRYISPVFVASEILQESLSEASAEISTDQEIPSWTAVTDFFEWKAGYAFEKCLSDCAVIISDMIRDIEEYVSL